MTAGLLEELYSRLNRRTYVHPDPLEFLYDYDNPADREIVGLIASSLAYGRVEQIIKSVADVLRRIGPPYEFLMNSTPSRIERTFRNFKHRFTTGGELASLLLGAKNAIEKHGSIEVCFKKGCSSKDETIIPALEKFVAELSNGGKTNMPGHLLPCPSRGSACKRLNLYLRWMVRRDEVDPGWWDVPALKLVVPLDVHMHRIARALGFTLRKSADLKTALEVTAAFKEFSPEDPVKYDFALTRMGIRKDVNLAAFLETHG